MRANRAGGGGFVGTGLDQAGGALDCLQDIVEIMCDAAGQLPQRLHPFRMRGARLRRGQGGLVLPGVA